MNSGKLPTLGSEKVSEFRKDLPYVITDEDAFPLKPFLIKAYSRNALATLEKVLITDFLEPEELLKMYLIY